MELKEWIRKFNSDLPIVMCTGDSATTREAAARGRGVDAFLTKPVDSKRLLVVIGELLEERQV